MAFGDNFYSTLSQYYRLLPFSDNPGTNVEKQQLFIEMTSKVSNRNLAPFFIKWGLIPTEATNQKIKTYPMLTKNIWENIIDGTHQSIVEDNLAKYEITTIDVSLKDNVEISFGTDINMTNYGKYFNYDQNLSIW
ncbi:M60 family metallopeptidase [Spiroplasma endosymbiont of Sarcophaga carnaria]